MSHEDFLSQYRALGGTDTTDQGIACWIAEALEPGNPRVTVGDCDLVQMLIDNVSFTGTCWQGREASVGIFGAGYTDFEVNCDARSEEWAVCVLQPLLTESEKVVEYIMDTEVNA